MRFVPALLLFLFACAPAVAQDAVRPALAVDASEMTSESSPAPQQYVVLKDGQMLAGDVRLMPSAKDARYALYNDERIELSELSIIHSTEGEFGVARHPQLGRSMLLQKSEAGRISVYDEMDTVYASGLQFFQKDDGQIMMLNQENLRPAVADNPESMKHLNRHSTYQKIGLGSLVTGAAMIATGAALHFGGYKASSTLTDPAVIATSGVLFATGVNFAIPMLQHRANAQAVHAYNR